MRVYTCLSNQIFENDDFHIEPIRDEDMLAIMEIRNQQIYHLRQAKLLTIDDQKNYFENVVSKLFNQTQPSQLLFSFFYKKEFIGYGGLVHINWIDKNAEISFVMKTELEKDFFSFYWSNYLKLIEKLAFVELKFHKIFTYAFDLRPHLYPMLINEGFKEEARLNEHCFFEGKFIDVLIHSKWNTQLFMRKATSQDVDLYFHWANDAQVRSSSYQSAPIEYTSHVAWFNSKVLDVNYSFLIFENDLGKPVGQVRIQKEDESFAVIGVSVDEAFRGKGIATTILLQASVYFLQHYPNMQIKAYIKKENKASVKSFEKAGFEFKEELQFCEVASYLYIKKEDENR